MRSPTHTRSRLRRGLRLVALAVLFIATWGCGGGSSGGVDPIPMQCLEFSAPAPPAGSVALREGPTQCNSLIVEVVVRDIPDVFTVSFTVTFDPQFVAFQGFDRAGSFLASDGTTLEPFEDSDTPGRVVVGLSRFAAPDGIDFVGPRLLGRLLFSRLADSGTSELEMAEARVFGSETPPVEKTGIGMSGGLFTVF